MVRLTAPTYVELHCHSAFSLLDGAALPETLVQRAAALGYPALALTDHDELGGAVRFAQAGVEHGVQAIIGAELTISSDVRRRTSDVGRRTPDAGRRTPDYHLVLLAEDREGYGNISTLITQARMHSDRGEPRITLDLLARHARGVFALTGCPRGWVPSLAAAGDVDGACEAAATLMDIFGRRLAIECWDHGLPEERDTSRRLMDVAGALGLPWVVTNDVHYARARDRMIHDVLACLRHERLLDEMGTRLRPNSEWYLKSAAQIARRWQHAPQGVRHTLAVAERCSFRMDQLTPNLPAFPLPPGVSADEYLERLVEQGAEERWGPGRGERHTRQLRHELALIAKLGLAGYFLIVWDIVRFARRRGILCQGRGSAANSAVCFCLGITSVDPVRLELLFERFLSEDRREAPDIDIDFAHEEREEVIQYVYRKYGREHAAMVCEQITYRGRSAVRDVARVLGFSVEQADRLTTLSDRFSARATAGGEPAIIEHAGLDPGDARVRLMPDLVEGLHQLPRHRSIHVGGFVLTREPLSTVVPIEPASMPDRTVIQWEKDDLDPVGLVKIDILGLGMLTLIQKCIADIRRTRGVTIDLARLDMTDQAVYDDLCRADTIGVFQVESRAQMNTLPRLKPRCFYDLVVEVAIIRPGPIQGDMVHPYLRRRAGLEPVTYPHPALEPILKRTLGVPLFQEQGMQVAVACAGFTAGEADVLRKAMGHKRSRERMSDICRKLIAGMQKNGIPEETAMRIYNQINAFADYGFPESHAASFALLVYASAYLRHYYAPEFTAAILNSQPMGFYAPGTIIEDAKRHGVRVLPIDVRYSRWDHTLQRRLTPNGKPHTSSAVGVNAHDVRRPSPEAGRARSEVAPCLRLGLRLINGLGSKAGEIYEQARASGPFTSISDFVQRTGFDRRVLRHLAGAGAFDGFLPDEPDLGKRRAALWEVLDAARGDAGPLAPRRRTAGVSPPTSNAVEMDTNGVESSRLEVERSRSRRKLPLMSPGELTEADYRMTGVSLNGHPMLHLRPLLKPNGILTAAEIARRARDGDRVAVAGLVICRQRPGTAKGFVFLTLEDETGMVNVVVTPRRFEQQALLISTNPLLLVRGVLQIEQGVINVRGERFRALQAEVGAEYARSHDYR